MNSKFFNAYSLSVSEYSSLLFSATNNNILKIPRFVDNDLSQGPDCHEYFRVDLSDKTPIDVVRLCKKYFKVIKLIADYKSKFGEDFLKVIKNSPETYSFWKTYISSLDKGNVDYEKMQEITELIECESATLKDWEYYDSVITERIKNAKERLDNNFYSYELIVACQRLFKLYTLNAPKVVTDNEKINFAETVFLYCFAKSSYSKDCEIAYVECCNNGDIDNELYEKKKNELKKIYGII